MDKKVSFTFNRFHKKPDLKLNLDINKKKKLDKEVIQYLEDKNIKVIGGDSQKTKKPLVIPVQKNNPKLVNLQNLIANNFEVGPDNIKKDTYINTNNDILSLDERATNELINDARGHSSKNQPCGNLLIHIPNESESFNEQRESTVEDYAAIPIEEFGKAMLRGMGWKDGGGIGKTEKLIKVQQPILRPKGLGLGADKMIKVDKSAYATTGKGDKPMICKKGAYVRVIAGQLKGNYGQIVGLDEESGRIIVRTVLNDVNVSINEFLVRPVTEQEFNKNSRVINNPKYEQYLQLMSIESDNQKYNYEKEKKINKELRPEKNDYREMYIPSPQNSDYSPRSKLFAKDEDKKDRYRRRETKHRSRRSKYSSDDEDHDDLYRRRRYYSRRHDNTDEDDRDYRRERSKKYASESNSEDEETCIRKPSYYRESKRKQRYNRYRSDSFSSASVSSVNSNFEKDRRKTKKKSRKCEDPNENSVDLMKKQPKKSKKSKKEKREDTKYSPRDKYKTEKKLEVKDK